MMGGIKNMKKFIKPEMNMVCFDAENIVTVSTAEYLATEEIKKNGVTINGQTHTVDSDHIVTLIF